MASKPRGRSKRCGKSKTPPMPPRCSPDIGQTSNDTAISAPSTRKNSRRSTSSAAATRANHSRSLESGGGRTIHDIFGQKCSESFAHYDRASSSWKTSQATFLSDSGKFSERWPRAGSMRNGIACRHLPSAPLTAATGCSSWPTPRANERQQANSQDSYVALSKAVRMPFATPTVSSAKGSTGGTKQSRDLRMDVGGQLNPTWVEWLMGFPLGWTALPASETPSSRRSRNGLAK